MNPFEHGTEEYDEWERQSSADGSDASGRSGGSEHHFHDRGVEPPEDRREDGAALLDETREWWNRYVTVMRESDLDVLTLWSAHTHAATRLRTTPRLQLDSAVPGSGKTTVLEHLERLCYRALIASSISSTALLARLVADDPRTLLLDEVDRTLDPKTPGSAEYIAILNSGYKAGSTRPTLVPTKGNGWMVDEMSTFAPVALAGNQPNLPDDTRTRIIRVLLLPDYQGRAAESDWELIGDQADALGARLARWVRLADLTVRPDLPPGVTGRFREKWLPLARIAHAAGGRWPKAVWDLSGGDVEEVRQDQEEGLATEKPAVLLLRHLSESWPKGQDFWRTTEMVEELAVLYPDSWGKESSYGKSLTIQRLGRLIVKSFRIRSTVEDKADKKSPRGYRRHQFGSAMVALGRSDGSTDGSPESRSEPPEPSEPPQPTETCSVCGERLDPVLAADGTHPGCEAEEEKLRLTGCTCRDYAEADDCGCGTCREQALGNAGCPHRMDQIMAGQARNDRLYDGMCDDCFVDAREVRDCGLRVAEHAGTHPGCDA